MSRLFSIRHFSPLLFTPSSLYTDVSPLFQSTAFNSTTTSPEETTALKADDDQLRAVQQYTIRLTRRSIALFSLTLLLLLVSLLASLLFFAHASGTTCTSIECVNAAAALSQRMDAKADPCNNFYEYSCGGWDKRTRPRGMVGWHSLIERWYDSFDMITGALEKVYKNPNGASGKNEDERLAAMVYSKCLEVTEEERNKAYLRTLMEMGGWPLDDPLGKSLDSVEEIMVKAFRHGTFAIFSLQSLVDSHRTSHNILTIEEQVPLLTAPLYFHESADYDLSSEKILYGQANKYIMAMRDAAARMAEMAGLELTAAVNESIAEMILFEWKLTVISPRLNLTAEPPVPVPQTTVRELQSATNAFDWQKYLLHLFGYPLKPDTRVAVPVGREWLARLHSVLAEYRYNIPGGDRVIENYIKWKTLVISLAYTGKTCSKDEGNGLPLLMHLFEANLPRSTFCLLRVKEILPLSLVSLVRKIVGKDVDENIKTMNRVGASVKEEYGRLLRRADDLSEEERQQLLSKFDKLRIRNAIAEAAQNETAQSAERALVANLSLEWSTFMVRSRRNVLEEQLRLFEAPIDQSYWPQDTDMFNLNVYYNYESNAVVFPVTLSFDPFVNHAKPAFSNFAGYGAIIGHEMHHAFDLKGRRHDAEGNIKIRRGGDASTEGYMKKAQCFLDQYESMSGGNAAHSAKTLAENLADNVGFAAAYEAWKSSPEISPKTRLPGLDINVEQAFFLSYAQLWCTLLDKRHDAGSHSYFEYRVLGSMQNSEAFASAFQCPVGSPMNPEKKCKLW